MENIQLLKRFFIGTVQTAIILKRWTKSKQALQFFRDSIRDKHHRPYY